MRQLPLLCLVLCWAGCAQELENPDDFAFLLSNVDAGVVAGSSGAGSGGAGSGGAGSGGMGAGGPSDCAQAVFEAKCADAFCHDPGEAQVDLLSDGVADRLVDQTSSPDLFCADRVFIDTSGGSSLLIEKISDPEPCGSPMPLGRTLTTDERSCLEEYVRSLGGSVGGGS